MKDLLEFLSALDAQDSLAARHLQVIALIEWVRGDKEPVAACTQRVSALIVVLEGSPELAQAFSSWWNGIAQTIDLTTLLADFGFAPRASFVSELAQRLRDKLLPHTPETSDAAELFKLSLDAQTDAQWIAALDSSTLQRLAPFLNLPSHDNRLSYWQNELLDAITYCASQVRATGFVPDVRLRMGRPAAQTRPFHALAADAEAFRAAFVAGPSGSAEVEIAATHLRERLELCRQAVAGVYSHLQEHGVSVGLVFQLRQMRKRIVRIRELMDCLLSPTPFASVQRLFVRLANLSREARSVRVLLAANSSLLAAKVAERSAESGEQYITRDHSEYRAMLRKAAGGGAVVSVTTLMKFVLATLSVSVFWAGFINGMNYALSFIAIQLLHWTLATKQPAITASAMAAKLKDIHAQEALTSFVDEVTHLVRSQVAAVIGNLALVIPCVLALSYLMRQVFGQHMISAEQAGYVLRALDPVGPMMLFAAFTGILLFLSSLIAGWVENWFVLHRLDSALRYHPDITLVLGEERADRWARYWRSNISGFAANISLGFMLGLMPAFSEFFGLGMEVRHVTLSMGQLTAAIAALGLQALNMPLVWWCLAGIPIMGLINLTVSFYCAFRVALLAHNVSGLDRVRIRRAVLRRLFGAPLSFLWPPKRGSTNIDANQR
jgi:site-specific recombinase